MLEQVNHFQDRVIEMVHDIKEGGGGGGHHPIFTGGQIVLYITSAVFFALGSAEDAKIYVQIIYYILAIISISCGLAWAIWNNRKATIEILMYLRKVISDTRKIFPFKKK